MKRHACGGAALGTYSGVLLTLTALLCSLLPSCAAAAEAAHSPEDPMASDACYDARAALDVAMDAALKDRQKQAATLIRARRAVAAACLGDRNIAPSALRPTPPAVIVATPPVGTTAPASAYLPAPVTAAPLPPVAIPRPSVTGNCDATGCWDNGGTRLNQVGPTLVGPRGVCSVQGVFASCP